MRAEADGETLVIITATETDSSDCTRDVSTSVGLVDWRFATVFEMPTAEPSGMLTLYRVRSPCMEESSWGSVMVTGEIRDMPCGDEGVEQCGPWRAELVSLRGGSIAPIDSGDGVWVVIFEYMAAECGADGVKG